MKSWTKIGIFAFSALSLGVVACSGSDGAAGPAGAKGDTGEAGAPGEGVKPSAGVVVPNIGLLDRELDVTVTGDAIDFTAAAPTLDFGAGVTVSKIQVLSGTTLVAHLAVDAAAATGARDVKITEGPTTVTAKSGFTVAAPIAVTVTPAQPQQGGVAAVDIDNLDALHAFDTSGNFYALLADGTQVSSFGSVTATQATGGLFLIDPLAAASSDLDAVNVDANYNPVVTYAGPSVTISARAATTATPGTPLTAQNLAAAGATQLYKYTTASSSILEVLPVATGTTIQPIVAVYGASGKNADLKSGIAASLVYPTDATSTDAYAIVLDGSLGGGAAADYGFTFSVVTHTGTAYAEPTAAHETLAHATTNATVTALPLATTNNGDIITGALTTGTEEDWYAVSLAAGDTLEIAAAPDFDATVDVTDNAGNGLILDPTYGIFPQPLTTSTGARTASYVISTDSNGDPLPAAKYYVHVTSTDGSAHGNYLISLRRRPAAP